MVLKNNEVSAPAEYHYDTVPVIRKWLDTVGIDALYLGIWHDEEPPLYIFRVENEQHRVWFKLRWS